VVGDAGETVAPALVQYVLDHAQGSPRDIVMLVDVLLRENLVAVCAKGVHDLTKKARRHSGSGSVYNNGDSGFVGAEVLPDGVWGALVSRIDMLSAAEADLLKCAAIIGAEFPVDILEQTMEHASQVLLSLLESIEAQVRPYTGHSLIVFDLNPLA